MSLSKMGWVVAGIAAGAAAAWSFAPREQAPTPTPVVAPEPALKSVAVTPPRPLVKKRAVAKNADVPADPKPLINAPDVSACGAHVLVATEVIAHVRSRDSNKPPRVTVSATPASAELANCVRERVSTVKLPGGEEQLQTFRYAFKPQ